MNTLIYLIPILPLIGFIVNGSCRQMLSKKMSGIIATAAVVLPFALAYILLLQLIKQPTAINATLFNFIDLDNLHIPFAFQIDQLSILFVLTITGVGALIHIYSTAYMHEESSEGFARYFAYLNLFIFFMLLLVLGNNYLIMFIGWEGVGLCSYLLIGFWFKDLKNSVAAKKAFIMNRIGDAGFLLALFWIMQKTGSLTFTEVFTHIGGINSLPTRDVTIIATLLFIGAIGKSAQIPLYTWLPDAMAGPTPVSALIHAATMVTAGIYMVVRSNVLYTAAPATQTFVAIVGLLTALFAATIALKQTDIKKILAYSTISQLGYMFIGLGVGCYTGAVFHVMTHAFFKALLFLGAGSVIHAMRGKQDITKMGGLKAKLPITHITFLFACFAIVGMPPFSGFFSKDEILAAAYLRSPMLYYAGLLGALFTAFYMFRLYAMTFLGNFRGTKTQAHHLHESPLAMTLPLRILAVLAVVAGFIGIPAIFVPNVNILEHFLSPIFSASEAMNIAPPYLAPQTAWSLMLLTTGLVVATVVVTWLIFKHYKTAEPVRGFAMLVQNKFYVDEWYQYTFVTPLLKLSIFFSNVVEKSGIDAVVNGTGKLISFLSRRFRLMQTGQAGTYVLMMVLGMMVLIFVWINDVAIEQLIIKWFH